MEMPCDFVNTKETMPTMWEVSSGTDKRQVLCTAARKEKERLEVDNAFL